MKPGFQSGVRLQCFTTAACSFGSLIMGIFCSWPSYTLNLYTTSSNTTLLSAPMTPLECSLVGSLPFLGAMVGTGSVGLLIDRIGRQKGGVVLVLPYTISWLIVASTNCSTVILVARFIGGISGGAFLVFAPVFTSEVAQDSIRGALASGPVVFYTTGALTSYIFGWFLSYRIIIYSNIALCVVCALLCFLVVESPIYLLKQNKEEDAKQAIAKYRGVSPNTMVVSEELSKLKAAITQAVELVEVKDDKECFDHKPESSEKEKLREENEKLYSNNDLHYGNGPKMTPIKVLFLTTAPRRAFVVVVTSLTLQILTGIVPVMVYAKQLFTQAVPTLSSHFCSVLLAIVLTSGSVITAVITDRAGRRVLLMLSSVSVGVCMVTLGILLQTNIAPPIVSAVVILIYCICFNCGVGTVPYVLLAEMFTPEVHGLASMLILQWMWLLNSTFIAIFPFAINMLGVHGIFYVFAGVSFVNAIITYFKVPETKGLSILEIQALFRSQ